MYLIEKNIIRIYRDSEVSFDGGANLGVRRTQRHEKVVPNVDVKHVRCTSRQRIVCLDKPTLTVGIYLTVGDQNRVLQRANKDRYL